MPTLTADDLRSRADELRSSAADLRDRAEEAGEQAADAIRRARTQAEPKVKDLRDRAKARLDDVDTDRLRAEAKRASSDLGHQLVRLGVEVGDATRHEAERLVDAVRESAEEARQEKAKAARDRRVRALVGWTLFGVVAGAVLARRAAGGQSEGVLLPPEDAVDVEEDGSATVDVTDASAAEEQDAGREVTP